jgi:hypothetical protein
VRSSDHGLPPRIHNEVHYECLVLIVVVLMAPTALRAQSATHPLVDGLTLARRC